MTIIDLEQLTPEEQYELLDQLKRRRDAAAAEQEARLELDRVLRKRLAAQGISEGDQWAPPSQYECAYPSSWLVDYNGQQWLSLKTGALGEPGESEDWTLVYGDEGEPELGEGEQDE